MNIGYYMHTYYVHNYTAVFSKINCIYKNIQIVIFGQDI